MMKKILLSIIFLCSTIFGVCAQSERETSDKPKIVLKYAEYDFGTISDKTKVSHSFEFVNEGNCPLVITKAMVSCKCIDINYPKKPVAPGAKSEIIITYNPKKQQGVFYKAIQIFSNDVNGRIVLTVKGKVQPEKKEDK